MTNRSNHSTFRGLPTSTLVHHVLDDERERDGRRERKCTLVISMQQTEHCISAILMWWSRPGHRQTALSSSSLLCTHQGLCRDLQPTTVVREQQMGRIRACQTYVVHFLCERLSFIVINTMFGWPVHGNMCSECCVYECVLTRDSHFIHIQGLRGQYM